MEMMASNDYRQSSLPRLATSKDICRRDSLSSSRTRDSGYNSDLEVSLSPLDFLNADQDVLFAPLPPVPEILLNSKSAVWKKCPDLNEYLPSHQPSITSCPLSTATSTHQSLHRNRNCNPHRAKIHSYHLPKDIGEKNLASQDEDIERWIKDNLPSRNRPQERVSSITSLSSTSSCDMYSSADFSEDEPEDGSGAMQSIHPKSTLKVIELILRKIEVNLCYAAYKQCTGSSDSSRAQNKPGVWSQERGRKGSQSSGQKRKSRLEGSPPPEDDEEDGPNKRRRGSATTTDSSEAGARFACPFYKHDPDRYRHRRTCPGPGWPTVHRMKEHLYRSHSQPIFCPICYSTFKSDKEQSNHVRLQQCQRMAPQQIEGIDRETVWVLRKRTTGLKLEEDKWRDVYHILFPEVSAGDIPSPFYDCDSPSEASRRFRRDLLRRVQEELFTTAGQTSGPVEQQLLRQVAEIIRRCENELLHPVAPSMAEAPLSDRRPSHSSIASAGSLPSSPYAMLPVPSPSLNPTCESSSFQRRAVEHCNAESNRYAPLSTPLEQHVDEPTNGFTHIDWGEPEYGEFGVGLDWVTIFAATADGRLDGNESFATLNAPTYT